MKIGVSLSAVVIQTWDYWRRKKDALLDKTSLNLSTTSRTRPYEGVVAELETLTGRLLVTLSKEDLGLTLSIRPVSIGHSMFIPKIICDTVRGVRHLPRD